MTAGITLPIVRTAVILDGNGEPVSVPIEGDDGRGVTREAPFGLILVDGEGRTVDIYSLLGGAKGAPDAIVENLAGRDEFDDAPRFFAVLVTDTEELYFKLSADHADWSGPVPWLEADALDGFTHTQGSPSATWTINHNLGRKPIVTLLTTGGVAFEGQITHVSVNQCVVNLAAATAGTARCL